MADAATRELERRWRVSRDRGDLLAWLRARQQAGELGEVRLRLAAHLGSDLARELRGRESARPVAELARWWDSAVQLARSTGQASAASRAQFVLTGQAGPPSLETGLDPTALELRGLLALARALERRAGVAREALAHAVAGFAVCAREPSAAEQAQCAARIGELRVRQDDVVRHLPAEWAEELFPEPAVELGPDVVLVEGADPAAELAGRELDLLGLRLPLGAERLEPDELEAALPLIAFLGARACCARNAYRALALGQLVLGTQELADTIGAALAPWVLGIEP